MSIRTADNCEELYDFMTSVDRKNLNSYKYPYDNCHMTPVNLIVEYKKYFSSAMLSKTIKYLVDECNINPFEQSHDSLADGGKPDDTQIITREMCPNEFDTWKQKFCTVNS